MKLSKNLTSGCFCIMRGDKLCKVHNRVMGAKGMANIVGVFHPLPTIISCHTRLFNGDLNMVSMDVPAGIRIKGFDQVEVDEELKK